MSTVNPLPSPGDVRYVPYPDGVDRVRVICLGTDRRFTSHIPSPVTVRTCPADCAHPHCERDHEYAIGAAGLYIDPLAAAIRSAEMGAACERGA